MIGWLRGEVKARTSSTLLLNVNDVGYLVNVSAQCTFGVGQTVELYIHTHVREDALLLYGFADELEHEVFDLLITVPSVGPVKAMQILATTPFDLIDMVVKKDPARIAKLPGVGKKTAERMLVDLFDKMVALRPRAGELSNTSQPPIPSNSPELDDLTSALLNLGFRPAIAEEAAASAVKRLGHDASMQALLKDALMHAGGR